MLQVPLSELCRGCATVTWLTPYTHPTGGTHVTCNSLCAKTYAFSNTAIVTVAKKKKFQRESISLRFHFDWEEHLKTPKLSFTWIINERGCSTHSLCQVHGLVIQGCPYITYFVSHGFEAIGTADYKLQTHCLNFRLMLVARWGSVS